MSWECSSYIEFEIYFVVFIIERVRFGVGGDDELECGIVVFVFDFRVLMFF